ncbi:MAG TPA: hypothetical protein DEQ61_26545 [Streptomyces sp.]|nr:hypothetical protein [Streptomyces sp.]
MRSQTAADPRPDIPLLPGEPPEAWQYSIQLPHDPLGPRIARSTVRVVLAEHGLADLAELAELLTSELATNAFRYSGGPVSVRLKWRDGTLRVSVWDTSANRPAPAVADIQSEHGRGLLLLAACADDWGTFVMEKGYPGVGGKVVWFSLERPARSLVREGGQRIVSV